MVLTKKRKLGNRCKKVDEQEMNKCNNFCNTDYLEMYRNHFRKTMKTNTYIKATNTYIKSKSNSEIEKLLKNINLVDKTNECKQIFCNPKCNETKKLRYVCPACVKYFEKVRKKGAITFCKHTSI